MKRIKKLMKRVVGLGPRIKVVGLVFYQMPGHFPNIFLVNKNKYWALPSKTVKMNGKKKNNIFFREQLLGKLAKINHDLTIDEISEKPIKIKIRAEKHIRFYLVEVPFSNERFKADDSKAGWYSLSQVFDFDKAGILKPGLRDLIKEAFLVFRDRNKVKEKEKEKEENPFTQQLPVCQ